jgi:hypothetical protein
VRYGKAVRVLSWAGEDWRDAFLQRRRACPLRTLRAALRASLRRRSKLVAKVLANVPLHDGSCETLEDMPW